MGKHTFLFYKQTLSITKSFTTMRKKINRNAVCSSDNYEASKRVHLNMLEERHSHFNNMVISGEISIDVPIFKDNAVTPKFKTIRIFGRNIKVSIEEYNIHCKALGL